MKKRLIGLLLVVTLVFSLSACAANKDKITINLWHIYVDETDINRVAIEEFAAQYMEEHSDVIIKQHVLQDADYKTKMLTEFSGSASNIDIFTYWGAGRAGDLVNAGKLLCIEDYLTAEQIGMIKPGADNNFVYSSKLYGLPMTSWMMLLYCNTELFEQNNVKLPETYDEWLAACKAFANAGITPVALGGGVDDGWQAAFVYEALVNRIVGTAAESDVLNSMAGFSGNPGFEEAAEKMVELTAAGAFGKSPLEIDEVTANVQFLSGAAAMRLTGSWFTPSIYTDEDSVVADKVVALSIPTVANGKGLATDYVGGFIDGLFINAATQNPEVAVDIAYNLAVAMATRQHEEGEGFTAYKYAVDESGLSPLGVAVSALAGSMIDGFVAWDTFLPGDLADIHIDACQSLLATRADVKKFLEAYEDIFS